MTTDVIGRQRLYTVYGGQRRRTHDYIFRNGFRLYTDHRNLQFMFNPDSTAKLNARARLDRWSLKLQGYKYDVEHIPGDSNVWADLLSRWGNHNTSMPNTTPSLRALRSGKRKIQRRTAKPMLDPLESLPWPTNEYIKGHQEQAIEKGHAPANLRDQAGGLKLLDDRIWIPDECEKLKQIIIMIAHYEAGSHYGNEPTARKVRDRFTWKSIGNDVKMFIHDCILCRTGKATTPTRIHLGERERPTKPNQHLHFDYYYVGESSEGYVYLLVIRDAMSRFTMLHPCDAATSMNAARGLMKWIATFGVPELFFSDNGSHFRCETMRLLAKKLDIKHEFSTAYCAWSNGLAERVNRDIKALVKIILIAMGLDMSEWDLIVDNVQYALNQRTLKILKDQAPVTIHTGMRRKSVLDLIVGKENHLVTMEWSTDMNAHLNQLQETLNELHEEANDSTKRINANARRKKREDIPEFEIGDYVIMCRVERPGNEKKHDLKWIGPVQIVGIKSKYVYEIMDLIKKRTSEVHATRLSFYSDGKLDVTGRLIDLISKQGDIYEIEELLEIQWEERTKTGKVLVQWRGFTEVENSWEPFDGLLKQVPALVLEALSKMENHNPSGYKLLLKENEKRINEIRKNHKR